MGKRLGAAQRIAVGIQHILYPFFGNECLILFSERRALARRQLVLSFYPRTELDSRNLTRYSFIAYSGGDSPVVVE